jgi:hypothetical protein
VLTGLLSLSAGYILFFQVFPVVAFPALGEMPLAPALGLLVLVALIAGFAADDLALATVAAVLSTVLSVGVAGLIAIAPLAAGFSMIDPGSAFAFVVHYGFPFILVSFAVNIGGSIGGYALRERYILAPPSTLEASERSQRK